VNDVFITGAAGFIGGHTVREFLAQGWHVLALIHRRTSDELKELAKTGCVTLVHGDVTDRETIASALRGRRLDAIVHCAGRASDVGRKRAFSAVNIESVKNLTALARELSVPRFVFVSSTDVYGLRDFHGEDEGDLSPADRPCNPYPWSKIEAEKWIMEDLPPDRWAIVRPAAVWGANDPTMTRRVIDFLGNTPRLVFFGKWHGRNRWPLAHVRNTAAAIFVATTMPQAAGCPFNVLDNEWTSVDEFFRIVGAVYYPDKTFKSVTLPCWLMRLPAALITLISNMLALDVPFMDPSSYALKTVSSNLDFSNQCMRALFRAAGRDVVTRAEGISEMRDGREE
jgi:nucleoside-diphosphate-sugar epimerase